jgi:hypothetical protein
MGLEPEDEKQDQEGEDIPVPPPGTKGSRKPEARFSKTPIRIPATTAPGMESSPPRMTTGKTLRPMWTRPSRLRPAMVPTTMPAAAAVSPAAAQARAKTRSTETPRLMAAIWSSATLRMAMPRVERWKNQVKASKKPTVKTAARSWA